MFETAQETVDRLAATLTRSVVLLDAEFLLVSHSRQYGTTSEAQLSLLTERRLDAVQLRRVREAHGSQRHTAFLIEDDVRLGRDPQLYFPLRSPRSVHGYLAVTLDRLLSPGEFALIQETSEVLRHLTERTEHSIADSNETIESEVLTLLSEDAEARRDAADVLRGLGMFPQAHSLVAMCLRTEIDWTNATGPPPRDLLLRVLLHGITAPMIHSYTFVPSSPEAFVIIGFSGDPTREALQQIVLGIERELALAAGDAPLIGRLGVGGATAALEQVWRSYDQARVAAEIARVKQRAHAYWSEESVAASALSLLAPPSGTHLTPDLINRLERAPDETVELFEAYFAFAGSIAQVAEHLHMHRSTVYLRLERSAKTLGIDFADGDSRFLIQAWLLQRRYFPKSGEGRG